MTDHQESMRFRGDFGVVACDHVFRHESPVLLVVRDEEQSWQFLCGAGLENDQCRHVGVEHLLERDSSLETMASLAVGSYAERSAASEPWKYGRLEE